MGKQKRETEGPVVSRLRSILVGIDFTPYSENALIQAIRIARWNQAALHLIHVIEPLVLTNLGAALPLQKEDLNQRALENARESLHRLCQKAGVTEKVSTEAVVGSPLDEILKKVQALSADLLVLGQYGSWGAGSGVGTLAANCARKASTQVLLVQESQTGPFQLVVACVDFSRTSECAVEEAARLAAQDKCPLHLLHVWQPPWNRLHYRAPSPASSPDFRQQYQQTLEALLEDSRKSAGAVAGGLDITCKLWEHASYGRGIVEYSRRVGADLVVLGTKGHSNLRYLLLGSTAERVLRELPCSVLAVKPPHSEQEPEA